MTSTGNRRRHGRATSVVVAATAALATAGFGSAYAAEPPNPPDPATTAADHEPLPDGIAFFDSRATPAARRVLDARAARLAADPATSVRKLRAQLGIQGVVDIDPLTRTPRAVARLDGYLTAASDAKPAAVASTYLRRNAAAFGLTATDVDGLQLRKDYVDVAGTHHLSFVQSIDGVPVFGNGVKANVAKDGRLVNVLGAPVSNLGAASLTSPGLSADAARRKAAGDVRAVPRPATASAPRGKTRTTDFTTGDRAQLVVFQTVAGPRTAWQTISNPDGHGLFLHVVDATDGRVLYRQSLTHKDNGLAFENRPGAERGGVQQLRNFSNPGWLPNGSTKLDGNVAHVYTDVNDDNESQATEEVKPLTPGLFAYPLKPVDAPAGNCSAAYPCTWDPAVPNSWQANREQDATQLFYFLGNFHDHLRAAPIGFTRAAGNFEAVDGDAVQGESLDGANTADGLPDANHVDNANMSTPPDGMAPVMQMYLFHKPGATYPIVATSSANEADIVYHEYTHGLSNRLVVDANGNSTLGSVQAGSMGEAWSDWYAYDYLVAKGLHRDTPTDGEMVVGEYVSAGANLIRTMPIDCPVGSTAAPCAGTEGSGRGGYTYGDFGKILGFPEVHADGEIWAQTLWDLRAAVGSKTAESLITRAMELSPANPSFLDQRNAILQADTVVHRGKNRAAIWKVFAARGMGFFAAASSGDDTAPIEDFSLPPAPNTPTSSLTGTVTDEFGNPASGVPVAFGGHASGFVGDYADVTDAEGRYAIDGIFPGTYPKVFAGGAGFDRVERTVTITASPSTLDWNVSRDWAAIPGGASVVAAEGTDYSGFGCGPAAAFDQSQSLSWTTDSEIVSGAATPHAVVLKLPATVDITEIAIDPSSGCIGDSSAGTKGYTVETSTDGSTWKTAATGEFTGAQQGKLNPVTVAADSAAAITHLRITMLSPQVDGDLATVCAPADAPQGCQYISLTEVTVHGKKTS